MNKIEVNGITIGDNSKPFIIAEMSGNHNQSLDRALELIDAAAEIGVDAIKIQTYTADTITINENTGLFRIDDKQSLWDGNNLYSLYEKAHTPWNWHPALFERAKELGIILFSTPFDETAVDFLEDLDNPIYKIASFENSHLPLLKKIAHTGKPVIMSTGMANLGQLEESVKVLKENGCQDLILLKCTSSYPASPENTNINTIPVMKQMFNCTVGLSDHTLGVGVAVASIALGARVIEKHFVLDRSEGGVDSQFSLEPTEFKLLVEEVNRAFLALGGVKFGPTKAEESSIRFRRSIYITQDIKQGETFTEENLRIIRPGDGLEPKFLSLFLGRNAKEDLQKGSPLTWDHLL